MRFLALAIGVMMMATGSAKAEKIDLENTLYLQLKGGRVVIKLLPEKAPKHVERIKILARKGFYDGLIFHRVIEGFMAQTGDPTGTGMGGSDYPDLKDEFNNARFVRGTVGAASSGPNTANSQFFICFAAAPHLNGAYTVWGQVVEGMEFVDSIARGQPPKNPDKIISMKVAADVKDAPAAEAPKAAAQ